MLKKTNPKKPNNQSIEDDFMKSLKEMSEPEKNNRKIGLYGELDGEKAELVVYSFLHLHDTRMKSVPRPLTATQKKKLQKAVEEEDQIGRAHV